MIEVGTRVVVTKGCKAREVSKGASAVVVGVEALGAEYGHAAKVSLRFLNTFLSGKVLAFYARHPNRLADPIVGLNDGRVEHRIEIRAR
jgi:hypothetical protein